jgi:hypothetical protein
LVARPAVKQLQLQPEGRQFDPVRGRLGNYFFP